MHRSALVLFSGGQDSTTCLAHALARYERVETVGFDYGQRHRVELVARGAVLAELRAQFPQWRDRLGADHMLDLAVLVLGLLIMIAFAIPLVRSTVATAPKVSSGTPEWRLQ